MIPKAVETSHPMPAPGASEAIPALSQEFAPLAEVAQIRAAGTFL
jgi:hypothetical protein